MANTAFRTYAQEHGGRVFILFLLFLLAIYQFINAGFNAFATVCAIPIFIIAVILLFKYRILAFWALVFVNFFLQCFNKNQLLPAGVPMSMYNEMIEIVLIAMAILDFRDYINFDRLKSVMLAAILAWCGFCCIEVLNDTCGLGINIGAWYTGARMLAFQILYAYIVFTLYLSTPRRLVFYLHFWVVLSLVSVFWTWKQINLGLTHSEALWLESVGKSTHVLHAGTLIRWFSTHNYAASYGIGAASTAVALIIIAITTKFRKMRYIYAISSLFILWGMFQSGTRTAIFCVIAGFFVFLVLSKSFKIVIPSAILGFFLLFILVFTGIGNSNQQIRRMRTAFNSDDASSNVRKIHQDAMKKYLDDAPWGIGLGMGYDNIPANNKYRKLSTLPPDSEYVFIWQHTGIIGITVFLITTLIMFIGACWIVFFTLKSPSLRGIGIAFCCAFVSQQLGGYGNQVLLNFPNCLIFYGGLSIVYALPYMEKEWIEYESNILAKQEEKKRLRLEKIEKMRVKPWYNRIYKYL